MEPPISPHLLVFFVVVWGVFAYQVIFQLATSVGGGSGVWLYYVVQEGRPRDFAWLRSRGLRFTTKHRADAFQSAAPGRARGRADDERARASEHWRTGSWRGSAGEGRKADSRCPRDDAVGFAGGVVVLHRSHETAHLDAFLQDDVFARVEHLPASRGARRAADPRSGTARRDAARRRESVRQRNQRATSRNVRSINPTPPPPPPPSPSEIRRHDDDRGRQTTRDERRLTPDDDDGRRRQERRSTTADDGGRR